MTKWAAVILAIMLTGCAAEKGHVPGGEFNPTVNSKDPAILTSLVVSTTTPETSRKQADRLLVEGKGKTDEGRLSALEQILYAPGQSEAMQIYALDQLAEADPGRAGRCMERYMPRMEGDVLTHACAVAVNLGDPRLVDAVVRSLARGVGDEGFAKRPEWAALEKLGGKGADEVLVEVVATAPARGTRIAALDVVGTRMTVGALLEKLHARKPGDDKWLGDVMWWMETFGTFPVGENESMWVMWLRKPEQEALVLRAQERHGVLKGQKDYVASPRFVHVLAYAEEGDVRLGRAALEAKVQGRLGKVQHVKREPEYPGARDDVKDDLGKLTRCDLLAVDLLLDGLEDGGVKAELYRQGLEDLSDATTEHGGLLAFHNVEKPVLAATLYPPLFANNNFEYVTGDKLIAETASGVAQYHFHFQQVHNAERAGPGSGDLGYAKRARVNCVVITSVGTREMNIDFYTPAGAVVDLGTYRVE